MGQKSLQAAGLSGQHHSQHWIWRSFDACWQSSLDEVVHQQLYRLTLSRGRKWAHGQSLLVADLLTPYLLCGWVSQLVTHLLSRVADTCVLVRGTGDTKKRSH